MIFVDSSAWIALSKPDDINFHKATNWLKSIREDELVTSNMVVIETLGWIRYKQGKKLALDVAKRLFEVKAERVTLADEFGARNLFKKLDGRGVSMIDCTSMAVMKRRGWRKIFTFDGDFGQAGFEVVPV
ncbi:hypothetical protein A2634_02295 [Candidatus Amesbacteria bacterium RIFCSPHIGHO2_01_FULL_48_32]|uniref:Ribonuclease VapC n=1 Tax=Candidatus Amesbacteria bacterium RIFCSPLOWO2_01_FULL_48_25 TaxID=1797259 RepID=A0A1F4ZE19_9BACT|nr:MAG: hypothetical protein A2634_02295 [Candidatus Amesbacteria bacterium RIFCSPHIGHO2_01_FULL_48_32]OGD04415.1 MAG: hypothetical protein A2989_05300 [Candidatus Amesbacteria bacterium RIFCSPLOWO2_01_FULL_48_25]HJZ06256.1 PIN domain-containing protein [Patescibacteria group bacterium]